MRRILAAAFLLMCVLARGALAQVMYIDGGSADRVHLRAERSTASQSYGLYFSGTPVEADYAEQGFMAVSVGMENGFIKSEYLKSDPEGIDSALRVGTAHTRAGYVNLRSYAADSRVIATVPDGDTVTVMGETANGWYYVEYDGQYGYMKSSLVRLGGVADAETTLRENLIFVAAGRQITARLHEVGGGEYERSYRVRFFDSGREVCAQGFTGDTYEHLRSFEGGEGSPVMHVTDVNMDGHADVSVIRYTGATEAQAAHFLYDPSVGTFKRNAELDALSWWRCELYLQTRMMLNYARDGAACGTWTLYQWSGSQLVMIATGRISYADTGETLRAAVYRDGQPIYEAQWSMLGDDGSEWQRQMNAMLDALWGGIDPGSRRMLCDGQ